MELCTKWAGEAAAIQSTRQANSLFRELGN
jgi:hypothetical protein